MMSQEEIKKQSEDAKKEYEAKLKVSQEEKAKKIEEIKKLTNEQLTIELLTAGEKIKEVQKKWEVSARKQQAEVQAELNELSEKYNLVWDRLLELYAAVLK